MVRHYSLMRLVIRKQVIWWKRLITCLKNLVKKRSVLRWKCCIKNLKTTIRRWSRIFLTILLKDLI